MIIRLTLFLLLISGFAYAQQKVGMTSYASNKVKDNKERIVWGNPYVTKVFESDNQRFMFFEGAQYLFEDAFLPRLSKKIELPNTVTDFSVVLTNEIYESLTEQELLCLPSSSKIGTELVVSSNVLTSKKRKYGVVSFVPIRKNAVSGKYEKLVSYELSINYSSGLKSQQQSSTVYASNSVLQTGTWYKMAISTDGIYKISFSFLQSLGMDMSTLNPQHIRIYGNGGEALSDLNSVARPDDLLENAIYVEGEGDGTFDADDYVLFYGKGATRWLLDKSSCSTFRHQENLYSDSAYYFITTDLGVGKRIQMQPSSTAIPTHTVTSFNDYGYHENDNVNFIKSGKQWFGEYFENVNSYNFSFSFPTIDVSAPASVYTSLASRYLTSGSALYSVSSQSGSASISVPSVSGSSYDNYARLAVGCYNFSPSASTITVNVTKQTADAVGWLDFIEVNVRRLLTMTGNQMVFRDVQSLGTGNIAKYVLNSSLPVQIWDISDKSNIKLQSVVNPSASVYEFVLPTDTLKEFVSFTGLSYNTPVAKGLVANQNLHSITDKDYIIVTHPDFYSEALQLAEHHETKDGLSSVVVTTEQVYNEFSSGAVSACAIRDFVKMFYDRATTADEMPRYLLLFGDGSYDNKKVYSNNTNFVPTYQSDNSTIPTSSYVSDDFFGLLDDNEGLWIADAVDIGVGRFPVKNKSQARIALNKVLSYTKTGFADQSALSAASCNNQTSGSPFGSWRNTICFIGDDEDGGIHTSQADQQATLVDTTYKDYTIDKIYLDAYQQEATPGGNRYPGVVEAINKRVEKGALIINYTGHGGELGLAHERIVEISQINKWANANSLFLFFTATCEFSRYDDPERTSAGEEVFLNPNGGAVALFSTVRLVFASPNFYLNRDFYKAAFEPTNGEMPRLGDLYEYVKNEPGGNSVNSRNFTLLGDPALMLAYPKYAVVTDSINHIAVTNASLDTLKALSVVTISGHVNDQNGVVLTTYNGTLYPTVYDKPQSITTLSNDGTSSPPFTFKLQKNILYKGKVSVKNGYYSFSFIVPKDIAYQYGIGRISYYAENGTD
ncbi:MAG: type IX secretion system sortase PorU, partial [Bacteroidia bacterium]